MKSIKKKPTFLIEESSYNFFLIKQPSKKDKESKADK